MVLEIYQVDAFTDRPFAGNPAAVCPLPAASFPAAGWMQALAAEMNLSETAFLVRRGRRGDTADYGLRWFTPAIEVELCGHATLAAAHVLWETGAVAAAAPIRFHTLSGVLGAARRGEWIELDFPAEPASALEEPPAGLAELLGAPPVWVGANRFDLVVELADEASVRSLAPDLARLGALPYRGILVTARASAPGYDVVSRFFAPASGVDADPVTGSAHCCVGPYWSGRLCKNPLACFQASARCGLVRVELAGDRVRLGGQAVTVFRGELAAPAAAAEGRAGD
ncbi:MAG TPA: PhzF family phenazine biosynthesis protein [Thermoanaerobaculia bacterium]|nr:PhzF family phenazine biosynthesis protein [Thermoanaerobaculia bacterium]